MSILELTKAVRQNHALEHATMHVLTWRHPYTRLMGRTTPSGFYIYGPVTTEAVADAAGEALERLQRGEAHLAVHPRCGTNLVVTSTLTGVAAFVATLGRPRSRLDRLPLVLMAATAAAIVAQPLAHQVQERVTTTPEVEGLYITTISRQESGRFIAHKVTVGRA
jgi:Domain of unknown function (DUF6391)